jgi:hypothetical protein
VSERAPILFEILEYAFFRFPPESPNGQVYFAMPYEKKIFIFPIKDGKISRDGKANIIRPDQGVELILPEEMGKFGLNIHNLSDVLKPEHWSD